MSKVKSPQEKKRNSLLKDCRNTYGECASSSRKNIRQGKQRTQQALRHAVSEELRVVKGASGAVDTEMVQDEAEVRSIEYSRSLFKKVPDKPLVIARERKMKKRARPKQVSDSNMPFDVHQMFRSEARTLRSIRKPDALLSASSRNG